MTGLDRAVAAASALLARGHDREVIMTSVQRGIEETVRTPGGTDVLLDGLAEAIVRLAERDA